MRLHRFESRQRLIIRLGIAMILVLCAGAWISSMAIERELTGRIDDNLHAEIDTMTEVLDVIDVDLIDTLTSQFDVGQHDWSFVIVDADGVVLSLPSGSALEPDPLPDVLETPITELRARSGRPFTVGDVDGRSERYRAVTLTLDEGRVAVYAESYGPVKAVIRIIHKTFAVGLFLILAALGTLLWIISRRSLRPLETVVDTAEQIGAGNLNARVEVSSTAPDVARLADALNAMLDRLQSAFDNKERSEAMIRQFASDASHELRTPLAAILGYAELYEQEMARSPEDVDVAMRRIGSEAARMQTLVEDLLLLTRLDEGRPLARDAVDLRDLVVEAAHSVRAFDGDHTIVVTPGDPVEVVGDTVALREVFDNLLTNVVTHTPAGTTATVSLHRESREVAGAPHPGTVVVVRDDGPGIDAAHVENVFDRFYRVEQARSRPGGSGLGLAIVDEIVRAHDGTVVLDTAPGEGTTFTIWLPDRDGADSRADDPAEPVVAGRAP